MLPPVLQARLSNWATKKEPSLEAKQEMADYVWQLWDHGLVPIKFNPQLETDMVDTQSIKRQMHPDRWEKVEEEFQELKDEVPGIDPAALEPFHAKGEFDTPLTLPQWDLFLAALQWPSIAIEKFLNYSVLKLDGRLRYQTANPGVPKEERKAALKAYEKRAAEVIFNA